MTSIIKTEVMWIVRYSPNKVSSFQNEILARQYFQEKIEAGRKAVKLIKQTTIVQEEVVSH